MRIDYIHIKVRKQALLARYTRVDKSELQVYPYFWQTYGPS